MPGLVDTHVHVNEPGRTDWEGFATATRAAAAGGVTTLIDMPLNSIPPTTTVDSLKAKIQEARNQCHVDVGIWGGVVPGNTQQLAALMSACVIVIKCFMIHTGVDQVPNVTEEVILASLIKLVRLVVVFVVHAKAFGLIRLVVRPSSHARSNEIKEVNACPSTYLTFLDS